MSIRNLDALFAPNTVAVFGASERPGSVGATIWRNLRAEFSGQLLGVNPKRREIDGVPVYPSAAALPAVPDLAVICTPAASVPGLIEELGRLGTRAAVVVTAGLAIGTVAAALELGHDGGLAGADTVFRVTSRPCPSTSSTSRSCRSTCPSSPTPNAACTRSPTPSPLPTPVRWRRS